MKTEAMKIEAYAVKYASGTINIDSISSFKEVAIKKHLVGGNGTWRESYMNGSRVVKIEITETK